MPPPLPLQTTDGHGVTGRGAERRAGWVKIEPRLLANKQKQKNPPNPNGTYQCLDMAASSSAPVCLCDESETDEIVL